MKDYNVKVTVRNNRILKTIKDAGYRSVRAFSEEAGLSYPQVNTIICMRLSAVNKQGRLRDIAQALCDALGALPEDLWSEEQLWVTRTRASQEYELSHDEALQVLKNQAAPDMLKNVEDKNEVLYLLESADLTDRELKVVSLLHEKEMTLEAIAAQFGLTRERIRQIEHKAYRKVRTAAAKNHYLYEAS